VLSKVDEDRDSGGAGKLVEETPVAIELRSRLQETQLARRGEGTFDWLELEGAYVRVPAGIPEGIVHFVGGALLGTYPQIAYDDVLRRLSEYGSLVVVATPYDLATDHERIASTCMDTLDRSLMSLERTYAVAPLRGLPLYGMGHSLGAKVQALLSCRGPMSLPRGLSRAGNILVSFNNFSASDSVDVLQELVEPLLEKAAPGQISNSKEVQMIFQALRFAASSGIANFSPSPSETFNLIEDKYSAPRTLLCKFQDDTLDQSDPLENLLRAPAVTDVSRVLLDGNHLSPVYVNLKSPRPGFPDIQLGEVSGVEALAMEAVSFIKGFR